MLMAVESKRATKGAVFEVKFAPQPRGMVPKLRTRAPDPSGEKEPKKAVMWRLYPTIREEGRLLRLGCSWRLCFFTVNEYVRV